MALPAINKYPSFTKVCEYLSKEEFDHQRLEGSQWVHFKYNVQKVLIGKYHEVLPLHVELSPTYSCNFACSWCSYSSTKKNQSIQHSVNEERNQEISWELLKEILDQLSFINTGIQWTGGEPTLAKCFIKAVEYATRLRIKQCLFTNGSMLSESKNISLLLSNLAFIRISLNSISPQIHSNFHGLRNFNFSEQVKQNLQNLLKKKIELSSNVHIGVSIVVNDKNIDDLKNTLEFLSVCAKENSKSLNYVIIRSVFNFKELCLNNQNSFQFENPVKTQAIKTVIKKLESNNVKIIQTGTYKNIIEEPNKRLGCLSSNWFGEIKPDGSLMMCSDKYGNDDYVIGNINNISIKKILHSKQKSLIQKKTFLNSCFPDSCPTNGRGFMLNNIFYQIEEKRTMGKINDVCAWIECIRLATPKPDHSFFI